MKVIILVEEGVSPFSVVKLVRAAYKALPVIQVYITRGESRESFGWEFHAVSALEALRDQEKEESTE